MAYKALYRKYRPSKFEDFAGQQQIVEIIKNAIDSDKVGHAYLFCGPRGTGKTSMAKMLAKSVNCFSENKPCDNCDSCIQANKNTHADIIELDAASNNGVDQIRDIIEKSKYLPVLGKYKVYIIDEVHMLSTSAFNALLKTLEEPPKHVIFILATTEPHKVLQTIVSRCQKYNFSKVGIKDIVNRMENLLKLENVEYTLPALYSLANLSDGGMRDALSLLDQVLAIGNKVDESMISFVFGKQNVSQYINLIDSIINSNMEMTLHTIEEIINQGNDLKKSTNDILSVCKAILIYNHTNNVSLIKNVDFNEEIIEKIKKYDNNNVLILAEIMLDCEQKFKFVDNIETLFEFSVIKAISKISGFVKECPKVAKQQDEEKIENKVEVIKTQTPKINESVIEEKILLKTIKDEIKNYSEKEILNFFIGANKQLRIEDERKFNIINDLLSNMKIARYTNIVKNCKIVASGENHIVLMEEFEPNINLINDVNTNEMISMMFKEELKIDKKIIGITNEDYLKIIKLYKTLLQQDKLPQFTKVVKETKEVLQEVNKENVVEEKLKRYFDDNILNIVEE